MRQRRARSLPGQTKSIALEVTEKGASELRGCDSRLLRLFAFLQFLSVLFRE